MTSIFLTAPTGYIGGSVLSKLLAEPKGTYNISVLMRSREKAAELEKFGVRPVIGTLQDKALLADESEKAGVVVHLADADVMDAVEGILEGLRRRGVRDGKKPIFVHTSGTGVLIDDARGEHSTNVVWVDSDVKQMNSLPDTQIHRDVDLAILAASDEVNAHIVLPSTIWGIADNVLTRAGIANTQSIQLPMVVRASLARGQAGMVGKGLNVWPHIHIEDVADLYILVLRAAFEGKIESTKEGSYFFGENGEYSYGEQSRHIAQAMAEYGVGSAEPTTFTEDDIKKYFGGLYLAGTNSRCRADHSRAIGWTPKRTTEEFYASVKPEVELIMKEDPSKRTFGMRGVPQ